MALLNTSQLSSQIVYSEAPPSITQRWIRINSAGDMLDNFSWRFDNTLNRWKSARLRENIVFQNNDSFFRIPKDFKLYLYELDYRCFPTSGGVNQLFGKNINFIARFTTVFGSIGSIDLFVDGSELYFQFAENGGQRNVFAAVNIYFSYLL